MSASILFVKKNVSNVYPTVTLGECRHFGGNTTVKATSNLGLWDEVSNPDTIFNEFNDNVDFAAFDGNGIPLDDSKALVDSADTSIGLKSAYVSTSGRSTVYTSNGLNYYPCVHIDLNPDGETSPTYDIKNISVHYAKNCIELVNTMVRVWYMNGTTSASMLLRGKLYAKQTGDDIVTIDLSEYSTIYAIDVYFTGTKYANQFVRVKKFTLGKVTEINEFYSYELTEHGTEFLDDIPINTLKAEFDTEYDLIPEKFMQILTYINDKPFGKFNIGSVERTGATQYKIEAYDVTWLLEKISHEGFFFFDRCIILTDIFEVNWGIKDFVNKIKKALLEDTGEQLYYSYLNKLIQIDLLDNVFKFNNYTTEDYDENYSDCYCTDETCGGYLKTQNWRKTLALFGQRITNLINVDRKGKLNLIWLIHSGGGNRFQYTNLCKYIYDSSRILGEAVFSTAEVLYKAIEMKTSDLSWTKSPSDDDYIQIYTGEISTASAGGTEIFNEVPYRQLKAYNSSDEEIFLGIKSQETLTLTLSHLYSSEPIMAKVFISPLDITENTLTLTLNENGDEIYKIENPLFSKGSEITGLLAKGDINHYWYVSWLKSVLSSPGTISATVILDPDNIPYIGDTVQIQTPHNGIKQGFLKRIIFGAEDDMVADIEVICFPEDNLIYENLNTSS